MPLDSFRILLAQLRRFTYPLCIRLLTKARHALSIPLLLAIALEGHYLLPNPVSVSTHAESPVNSAESQPQKQRLTIGENVSRQISQNELHTFETELSSDQFLHLTLSPQAIDLIVRVTSPDGKEVGNCRTRDYGLTPMSFIAESNGVYRIEITLNRTTSGSGGYSIMAERPRAPNETDRQRIEGERSFAAGDAWFVREDADSLKQAIREYDKAAQMMRQVDSPVDQAAALTGEGQAYFRLAEYKTATSYFQQALLLRKKIAGTAIEGEILNHLGYALIGLGENDEGLRYCSEALSLFRRLRNPRGEAQALTNLGEVYYAFSKLKQSLDSYQQALPIWQRLGDLRGQAQTLMNFAVTYSLLRESAKSNEYLQKSIVIWKQIDDRRGEALSLTILGTNYTRTSDWQQAGDAFYRALDYFRTAGDRFGLARTYNCIAFLKMETGQPEAAFALYQQSLPLWVAIGHREAEAGTRRLLGQIYLDRGEQEAAMENLSKAFQLARDLKDPLMQGYALISLGNANQRLSRLREALANYQHGLILFHAGGDRLREAMMLNSIGFIYASLGQPQVAIRYFNRALPLAQAVNQRREVSATLYNLAQAESASGNLSKARVLIEDALRISDALRTKASSQEQRAAYFATVHKQYEFYVDLLMQLARSERREPLERLALEVSERARARSLLDSLNEIHADIQANVDPALLKQEQTLRDKLNEKAALHLRNGNASSTESGTLKKEIDELTEQYERVAAQIKSSNPQYAALTQIQTASVPEIQKRLLADDSVLLEYLLSDKRSYLWVITQTEVTSYELPGRASIEDIVKRFRELLTANQPIPGETFEQRLARAGDADLRLPPIAGLAGQMLLGPAADKLGHKRLIIVPDGVLQYIPFQALTFTEDGIDKESANAVPLVVNHEIVYEPSASALLAVLSNAGQRHPGSNSVAIFANPVFESNDPRVRVGRSSENSSSASAAPPGQVYQALRDVGIGDGRYIPSLPASREEAEAIISTVPWRSTFKALDFAANRATITTTDFSRFHIVHFATHGIVDYEHPELSGLVLSLVDEQGRARDGFLRLHDIYNLKLPVDLVVLSACNTGLGKEIKGEGLIGLGRGFMYAGAQGVVASMWKVDDEATAELMKRFYAGMFQRKLTASAALRQAQVEMWQTKRWHAPYYWAAFMLQGQYNQTEAIESRDSLTTVIAVASLTLPLLTSFFFLIKKRRAARSSAKMTPR